MARPKPPAPDDHRTDPLLLRSAVVAVGGTLMTALVAFGLPLSPGQQKAVLDVAIVVVPLAAPLVAGWWARRHVYSPAAVHSLLAAKEVRRP